LVLYTQILVKIVILYTFNYSLSFPQQRFFLFPARYKKEKEGYNLSPPFEILVPSFSVLATTEPVKLVKPIYSEPLAAIEPTKVLPPPAAVTIAIPVR